MDRTAQKLPLIVLSYTAMCQALRDGTVTEGDLEDALFHPGCTREHAMQPYSPDSGAHANPLGADEVHWMHRDNPDQARELKETVLRILGKAEAENRIAWRTYKEGQSMERLNELLSRHNCTPLDLPLSEIRHKEEVAGYEILD